MSDVRPLPVGTVTFLRTDVEGSMALARALGARWDDRNTEHVELLQAAIDTHGGRLVRTEGDAVFAAFPEAGAAVAAAVDGQRAVVGHPWPDDGPIRVRMGLHSGEAHLAGDDYGGVEVSRAARIAAVGHGGQIVLSGATYELAADALPAGVAARDLGAYVLRDVPRPERLYELTGPGLPSGFPPLRAGRTVRGNLVPRASTFVGRAGDVEDLRELLWTSRLVTLTGPGGIGKTSLATEVARAVEGEFADGAWLVGLAAIDDAADVRTVIARTLGLFDGPTHAAADTLSAFLADRSVLLVLDNFEHLLDAAPVVGELLAASPASRVVVTSRAPLHVSGEQEYPVGPLPVESGAGSEATVAAAVGSARQLFVDRARAVRPGWEPGPDAATIDDICRMVDGLPLGIELAAARIGLLPPGVIRDRLAAHLPLPGPGSRDAPARQRTLEAAVAWSHDLLAPDLQTLLHDLAVFEGGFDLEQVDAVAGVRGAGGDRLDDLLELADRSLIVPVPLPTGGPRFRLLQTIAAFAQRRLAVSGREVEVRRRHAHAYLDLALDAERQLTTSHQAATLVRTLPDMPNLRAATRWAIEAGEADLALRLVAHSWRLWHGQGLLNESAALTREALAMPTVPTSGSVRAWAIAAAGNIAYWQADQATARRYYEAQVALAKAADDEVCLVDGLFNLGHVAFIDREDEAAQLAYIDDVVARYRDLGDERAVARAAWARAGVALTNGRQADAITLLQEGIREFERLDDPQYHSMSMANLGWANFIAGDAPAAIRWSVGAVLEAYEMGDIVTTTISLHIGVLMAVMVGQFEEAAVLEGAFEALCERYAVRPPAALGRFIANIDPFATTRAALDPEVYEANVERGRRLSLDEAVAMVVKVGGDASAARVPG